MRTDPEAVQEERSREALFKAIFAGLVHANGRHSSPGTIIEKLPENLRRELRALTSDATRNERPGLI